MSRLRVAPIAEGHGELECVRILRERIWYEVLGGEFIRVVQPIRPPRSRLVKRDELWKAVRLALLKINNLPPSNDPALVLLLLDADTDCPKDLAPRLLG
jgi:hypothetical protein